MQQERSMSNFGVQLNEKDSHVLMDNGIVQVTLSKPGGFVTGISYNGIDNILESLNDETNRGYSDLVWSTTGSSGTTGTVERIKGTSYKVVVQTDDQLELSFLRKWDISFQGKLSPLNIDKRYILRRGSSGIYYYAIYEHLGEWPTFNLPETRIVFKLRKDKFNYMAVADNRQRYMPLPDDRQPGRGQPLAYPEAVLLVSPLEPQFQGEVDDKYHYSCEDKDIKVHGWISLDPPVGFWQITPSNEFRPGGPFKQELTSHVGPITLAMFQSAHYAGEDIILKFGEGEYWKKVYGPVFMYLNSTMVGEDPLVLWEDAKQQMTVEVGNWPYNFPGSKDFQTSEKRGNVVGRLFVQDRFINSEYNIIATGAYVGLAAPGEVGSWQREGKKYQFWTKTDKDGNFSIANVISGDYNLYAYAPGFIGDYKCDTLINITPGCKIAMGDLVYEPARDGPTIWEIGTPNRSAREFYISDPNPLYINKLYVNHLDKFRQYGLWERYAELYPQDDLVFTIGQSDYKKNWFFAHVTRKKDDKTYESTTWQIKFDMKETLKSGTYKLRIALASASDAILQVRVNDPNAGTPIFSSGIFGKDNAIARHGIHGLYYIFNVDIQSNLLVAGGNTIFLTQANATGPFQGFMYDYIRLEAPIPSTTP